MKKKNQLEKNKIIATNLGRNVVKFLMEHFTNIFEYQYTADMEHNLDQIAEGTLNWKDNLELLWNSYKDKYYEMTKNKIDTTATSESKNKKII